MTDPTPQADQTHEQALASIHEQIDGALTGVLEQAPPPIANVLKFFRFMHLPPHLRSVSAEFSRLAIKVAQLPANAETTVALRKLLESKDAAVRATLP